MNFRQFIHHLKANKLQTTTEMITLFWGYQHRTLTYEIFQKITNERIEDRGHTLPWLRLYTQRWYHQMLVFVEFNALPHTFEWKALVDSARQYADTEELQDFPDWPLTFEQALRRTLFCMVL